MTHTTTSFTKLGAKIVEKLLTSKYGCTIITSAQFDESRGMWLSVYHDPSLEKFNEIPNNKNKRTRRNENRNSPSKSSSNVSRKKRKRSKTRK
jgi:hypothetical protein